MCREFVDAVLHGTFDGDAAGKMILIVLADFARLKHGGAAWPSVSTIAKLARLSDRSVQMHLHELVRSGWLSIDAARPGRGRSIVYRLDVARLAAARSAGKGAKTAPISSDHKGAETAPFPVGKRVQSASKRVQNMLPKGAVLAPEPVISLSIKAAAEGTGAADCVALGQNRLRKIKGEANPGAPMTKTELAEAAAKLARQWATPRP